MDYSKIGHHLKLVRERKGLSYKQIYEVTRIQPSILKDIEEGKSSVSPVFLKGFIKTYARFLGQDIEDIFKKARKEDKPEDDNKIKKATSNENKDEHIKRNYLKHLWPLLGLFIVFQVAVWIVNTPKKDNKGIPLITEKEKSDSKQETVEDVKSKAQKNITVEIQKEDFPEEEESLLHQIKKSAFTQDLLIQSSEPLVIYFKLDKNSAMVTKTLQASVWFHIKAKESIYLRFDENRGQVQIFYNGQQIPFDNTPFFERTFQ